MRKFIVAATLAALGLVLLLAVPASASFDRHFTVFEKQSFQPLANGNGFRFRGELFDRRDWHDRVGRDRGVCKLKPHETARCRGIFHLNGEIGGRGDIKYRGDLRPDDFRLIVIGGSGDFNGVAGKMVFRLLNRRGTKQLNEFDLAR